jgi:hypothetical protein
MPTINEYKHDPGYFIRAWTPDTSNINYKIRQAGNAIVEEYGLSDGDEISWETIQSLKPVGAIYTEETGTFGPDDVQPPEGSAKSLTESEAHSLLDAIVGHGNPSESEIERLCEILGVDAPKQTQSDALAASVESRIIGTGVLDGLKTTETIGPDGSISETSVQIKEHVDTDGDGLYDVTVNLFSVSDDEISIIKHNAHVCAKHGLEAWYYACSGGVTWQKRAELAQQQSLLLPEVLRVLDELGADHGRPDADFFTELRTFSELPG